MMPTIPIPDSLRQPLLWRFVGIVSSVIGLLCYALSSSFKHLFGEWNLLKIFLYGAGSFITCSIVLFAKKWQLSRSLMLKAHVGFLVLMLTSVYSFFYDKAMNGKADILGLISCGAFAIMSFSLSRQIDLGFEVDLLNFFLGCLTVQLMKINLMLASVGAIFCYFLIVLRSSLDSQLEIGPVNAIDHAAVDIEDANGLEGVAEHDSNVEFQSEYSNHRQELPLLRRRNLATTSPDMLSPRDRIVIYRTGHEAAELRVLSLKVKEAQFFSPEDEARRKVAAMKIQHAFQHYKTRKMTAAATRIQHTFRTWKIRKRSLHMHQQATKIQAAFRGFRVRKRYCKLLWSVGVIEKAILNWRFKRRGFRQLYVNPVHEMVDQRQESDMVEDFLRTDGNQAKEPVIKFVVHFQAMLHSKKAHHEYRRMKLAHNRAMVAPVHC